MGAQKTIRVLCCRELQKSIKDSVHQLLSDQIRLLGLEHFYIVLGTEIRGLNGTQFKFFGLRTNPSEIKSYEGIDIAWVEEAHNVRKSSWMFLIPTIRKEGSEIWVSFNPQLKTDDTYQRFVEHPPSNCITIRANWKDNPFFPEVLKQEMADLKERDFDEYLNVWEGQPRVNLAGAIYAKQLRTLREQDPPRITLVPHEALRPVDAFLDLGRADATAIWFAQYVNFQVRVVRYYENQGEDLEHYLQFMSKLPYTFGFVWLPHDAKSRRLGQKKTIQQQFIDAGYKARIVPQVSVSAGIEAGRAFMSKCWFDENLTADGIAALEHYRYDVIEGTTTFDDKPVHDWASHGADAYRYMALALRDHREMAEKKKKLRENLRRAVEAAVPNFGWMR